MLGDDAANRQYRSLLHFDTSALPDTAVIISARLRIRRQALVGKNPFNILGGLVADIRQPFFGGGPGLVSGDFQTLAGSSAVARFGASPAGPWYSAPLNDIGKAGINRMGTTQFRLRFTLDDNNDQLADFMKFYSGDAGAANRPQLLIQYYVP